MKTTDWFPADIKPVHVGMYETKSPILKDQPGWFCYWNGTSWCSSYQTMQHAYVFREFTSSFQDRKWRGLAEEPK